MLRSTALLDAHLKLGARLVEFGGWDMPIQYSGILDEHQAVRRAAGLFDISHMGELFVSGPAAEAFLNATLTNDVRKLAVGQGQYTLLCRTDGGVIDDLFAYRVEAAVYLLIVNASRVASDMNWLTARLLDSPHRSGVQLDDASAQLSAVAVQGPSVKTFIDAVFPSTNPCPGSLAEQPSALMRNRISAFAFGDDRVWFARTGYTGEDGFEIVAPNATIGAIWERLLETGRPHGLKPCGLGARDTLRLEMCFPLYGQELSETTSPIEAGLDTFVAMEKLEFHGRETMLEQKQRGPSRRLVAFRMTTKTCPPPRPHYPIWVNGSAGKAVGEATSGTLSPSLGVGIGLAYVPIELAQPGQVLHVEIRGRHYPAEVVKKPFYRRSAWA